MEPLYTEEGKKTTEEHNKGRTRIPRNHEFLELIYFPLLILSLFPSYFYVFIELV